MRRLALIVFAALCACQRQEPAHDSVTAAPTAAPRPKPSGSPIAAGLARYVGRYPSDVVGGTSFIADRQVRAAVSGVVSDAAVRARVLDAQAVATPVALVDGRVLSYACEPHDCGPHNWAIAVTPDGGRAAVCYYDEERGVARWYPDGAGARPAGGCPSGDE